EKIDDVSPYSTYSKSATPVLIYCNYMQGNFDSIHPMVEGFESLYPISNQLPYLYYIRTLAYFRVIGNYRKSMQNIENMFTMIHKLNNIAPESEYTQNVNKLIPYTVELQDKKDLYIAQNYLNMDNFISSGSRYSKLYTKTLDRQLKQNVEESMIDILKNLGIQE
ncbi:MAG: outer membrane protein assembly factor BamD, partial [Candidatus Deianiraeaceae bacterium]